MLRSELMTRAALVKPIGFVQATQEYHTSEFNMFDYCNFMQLEDTYTTLSIDRQ